MMIIKLKSALEEILLKDSAPLPRGQKFLTRSLQILNACIRDFADGQLSLRAMSLVYTTLITLAPLLAISFSVLKGFGVHNQIEPFILNLLSGLGTDKAQEIADTVIGFVDNIQVGVLGIVGFALLIYAVIGLMQKIEAAFNYIWRVGQERGFARRFSDYLSVLLLGPLLIFISAGITTTVRHSAIFKGFEANLTWGPAVETAGFIIPWLLMSIGFTFVYVYMPNTKVRISAAFGGAVIAALLWKIMGFVFASFIAGSANYVAIYAAFATLIVMLIWFYASWYVLLIGSNIAFYIQYPRYLQLRRQQLSLTPHQRMELGLSILTLITRRYYNGEGAWDANALSKVLNAPILAVQKVLDVLVSGRILTNDAADPPRYFPARALDAMPLQDAIDALEKEGAENWVHSAHMNTTAEARRALEIMRGARLNALSGKSIAEVLRSA